MASTMAINFKFWIRNRFNSDTLELSRNLPVLDNKSPILMKMNVFRRAIFHTIFPLFLKIWLTTSSLGASIEPLSKKHRHAMHAKVIFWGVGGLLETL